MNNDAYNAGLQAGMEAAFDGSSPRCVVYAALNAYEKVLDGQGKALAAPAAKESWTMLEIIRWLDQNGTYRLVSR